MYSAGGVPDLAFTVFDKMLERDVVSWTSIIDGLVDNDKPVKAIALFEHMLENDVEFNEATVVSVLRACAVLLLLVWVEKFMIWLRRRSLLI